MPNPTSDDTLEAFLRAAIARAAIDCQHVDPAGPIYDTTRACTECAAGAVMDTLRIGDALDAFRARYTGLMIVTRQEIPAAQVAPAYRGSV